MASPNQVTGYDPESLQIIQMDTAQTETPLPTEEEYLKDMELKAKQVGSSEPVQEAEAEDGDDGSSVTSRLTSVSRQDADTVVGPASITGSIGRIESLEHRVLIAQIKNTTQSDSPQVKRKPASRQAAEEGFSGPAPGPDRSSAP
ncbi:hypothetical protein MRX96_004825 [Rhipicephalus microplus]